MRFLAHRGHWLEPAEKNSRRAFERALQGGFGIETDLRDSAGEVVISHDMPRGGEMTLDEFLALCAAYPQGRPLALNIKADGLQLRVKAALEAHGIRDAFVFDMAVPDALGYLRQDLPTYTRCSEYENPPPYLAQAAGVWLDAFHGEWHSPELMAAWLAQGKAVCLVSPELHGRAHAEAWRALASHPVSSHAGMALCTDLPLDAKEAFHAAD